MTDIKMPRSKSALKNRKQSLWRLQSGRCHWCGIAMMHWNDLHSDPNKQQKHGLRVNQKGEMKLRAMPPTLATLDHLRDRFHPKRQIAPFNKEQRWVLACWTCNNERGHASVQSQPIEILHAKSRRPPRASLELTDDELAKLPPELIDQLSRAARKRAKLIKD